MEENRFASLYWIPLPNLPSKFLKHTVWENLTIDLIKLVYML